MLEKLKEELVQLHLELPKNNLVAWTSGNVSARDPETNLMVIKPSGIKFPDLTAASMVVVDMDEIAKSSVQVLAFQLSNPRQKLPYPTNGHRYLGIRPGSKRSGRITSVTRSNTVANRPK